MGTPEGSESRLPKVEQNDLLDMVYDELLDPDSQRRWRDFAHANPELARELHIRAFQKMRQMPENPSTAEMHHYALSLVVYAVTALDKAMARQEQGADLQTEIPPSPAV